MTHVDDLYEVNDREPGEPEQEPPLSLEQIKGALDIVNDKSSSGDPYQAITLLLDAAVPQMLADLREARQRIAEWEALPTRERWTVTANRDDVPGPLTHWYSSADNAERVARDRGGQLWRERTPVCPWEPIDLEAPL